MRARWYAQRGRLGRRIDSSVSFDQRLSSRFSECVHRASSSLHVDKPVDRCSHGVHFDSLLDRYMAQLGCYFDSMLRKASVFRISQTSESKVSAPSAMGSSVDIARPICLILRRLAALKVSISEKWSMVLFIQTMFDDRINSDILS